MLMLFVIQDLGSSLMFFGGFLALLYVATNRLSFPAIGLVLFAIGAWLLYQVRPTIHEPRRRLAAPVRAALYDRAGGSYQVAQSLFAQADGGLFGHGLRPGAARDPGARRLVGAAAARGADRPHLRGHHQRARAASARARSSASYLLAVQRGFKIATLARDSFSKLLAAGLTSVFALQVFVIVGGVTKVIPLTGVTLPFVSYGGSSILANFVLLALLLIISDQAPGDRRERPDRPPLRRQRRCSSRCSWPSPRSGPSSTPRACRTTRTTAASCSRPRRSTAGRSAPATARCSRAPCASPTGRYTRRYPQGGLFAHAVGYSYTRLGRAGLESSYNDELTGRRDALGTVFERLVGADRRGDGVTTTLDPAAQRVALAQLGGRKGSVVALDPRTGAVKVMANEPAYDPNALRDAARFEALNRDADAPLLDRATQAGYPPGSTFKVVTTRGGDRLRAGTPRARSSAGAARRSSRGRPAEQLRRRAVRADPAHDRADELGQHGLRHRRREARQGDDGALHGPLRLRQQAAIDLPGSERAASGERVNGRIVPPTSPAVDVGRLAIGQDKLTVTPLQMAMVAAAVANGGELMQPAPRRQGDRPRRANGEDDRRAHAVDGDESSDGAARWAT